MKECELDTFVWYPSAIESVTDVLEILEYMPPTKLYAPLSVGFKPKLSLVPLTLAPLTVVPDKVVPLTVVPDKVLPLTVVPDKVELATPSVTDRTFPLIVEPVTTPVLTLFEDKTPAVVIPLSAYILSEQSLF